MGRRRGSAGIALLAGTAAILGVVSVAVPASATASKEPTCTITGTAGDDILHGTKGPDVICGKGGEDRIYGMGGDDVLLGGAGDDQLYGGDGKDVLDGGPGQDVLSGDKGDDQLTSGRDLTDLDVLVLPDYQLPQGTKVSWRFVPGGDACVFNPTRSWDDQAKPGLGNTTYVYRVDDAENCQAKPSLSTWHVTVTLPDGAVKTAGVTVEAHTSYTSTTAKTICTNVQGATCTGGNGASFSERIPVVVRVTIGPVL